MLSKLEAYSTIPACDLNRAQRFYQEKLGLAPSEQLDDDDLLYKTKDSEFILYRTQYCGTAKHTLMGFMTPDLDREMSDLRSRGVVFEEYDLPGLKTVHGIAQMGNERGAWFKDSEGNILAVVERNN
jgi:catechol 2,3-dioxygenase-like lactoylglutathione lyase family enzyme